MPSRDLLLRLVLVQRQPQQHQQQQRGEAHSRVPQRPPMLEEERAPLRHLLEDSPVAREEVASPGEHALLVPPPVAPQPRAEAPLPRQHPAIDLVLERTMVLLQDQVLLPLLLTWEPVVAIPMLRLLLPPRMLGLLALVDNTSTCNSNNRVL